MNVVQNSKFELDIFHLLFGCPRYTRTSMWLLGTWIFFLVGRLASLPDYSVTTVLNYVDSGSKMAWPHPDCALF